jgi:hypothetical protein
MKSMSHRLVQRCAAILLLGVLGSGFALPGLDELLYHRLPANVQVDLAHVDQAGGCGSHAEHCIAAPTLYGPRLVASPLRCHTHRRPIAHLSDCVDAPRTARLPNSLEHLPSPDVGPSVRHIRV